MPKPSKIITVRRLDLRFNASQLTGSSTMQVNQAIALINLTLKQHAPTLGAELIYHSDEIETEVEAAPN